MLDLFVNLSGAVGRIHLHNQAPSGDVQATQDGVFPGLVHGVALLAPVEFDALKRAVGVQLRAVEQVFLCHVQAGGQRRERVKGHLRGANLKGKRVVDKRIAVGVLELRRPTEGVANVQVDGANLLRVTNEIGDGEFPVLPGDLSVQLLAKSDNLNLFARWDGSCGKPAQRGHLGQNPDLPIGQVSGAHRFRCGMLLDLCLFANQEIPQNYGPSRIGSDNLIEADWPGDGLLQNKKFQFGKPVGVLLHISSRNDAGLWLVTLAPGRSLRIPLEDQVWTEETHFMRQILYWNGKICLVEVRPGIDEAVGKLAFDEPQQITCDAVGGVELPAPRSFSRYGGRGTAGKAAVLVLLAAAARAGIVSTRLLDRMGPHG